jgi:hypothetical protein
MSFKDLKINAILQIEFDKDGHEIISFLPIPNTDPDNPRWLNLWLENKLNLERSKAKHELVTNIINHLEK